MGGRSYRMAQALWILKSQRLTGAHRADAALAALAEEDEGAPLSGAGVVITGSVVTAGAARSLFGKEPA